MLVDSIFFFFHHQQFGIDVERSQKMQTILNSINRSDNFATVMANFNQNYYFVYNLYQFLCWLASDNNTLEQVLISNKSLCLEEHKSLICAR